LGVQMKPMRLLAVLCLCLPLPIAGQEIGTVTLAEKTLTIIRGATVLHAAEGVRLRPGDILESGGVGFVQLELAGGTVVALGPSTHMMILAQRPKTLPELVLMKGWLKGETAPGPDTYCYASPQLAATNREGAVVLQASGDKTEIFVESGAANISKVSSDGTLASPVTAKAGQFFSRQGAKEVAISPRPDPHFVEGMPGPFRDTLPSRLSRFPNAVEPQAEHEVTYSEIQPWLRINRTWRKGFVERFRPRLKDPAFRTQLDAHLRDHPEWRPILHPENEDAKTMPAGTETPVPEPRR